MPEREREEVHPVPKMVHISGRRGGRLDPQAVLDDALSGEIRRSQPRLTIRFGGRGAVVVGGDVGDLELHGSLLTYRRTRRTRDEMGKF